MKKFLLVLFAILSYEAFAVTQEDIRGEWSNWLGNTTTLLMTSDKGDGGYVCSAIDYYPLPTYGERKIRSVKIGTYRVNSDNIYFLWLSVDFYNNDGDNTKAGSKKIMDSYSTPAKLKFIKNKAQLEIPLLKDGIFIKF